MILSSFFLEAFIISSWAKSVLTLLGQHQIIVTEFLIQLARTITEKGEYSHGFESENKI